MNADHPNHWLERNIFLPCPQPHKSEAVPQHFFYTGGEELML
jgi:hypothetical protein